MRHFVRQSASLLAVLTCVFLPSVEASAKDRPEIDYFLPRTDVQVVVAMTLTSCPTKSGDLPGINFEWTVVGTAQADPDALVRVDVGSGFLAKRSHAFVYYPNGTLSGFNGSYEGQGAVVLNSVLKLAGTIAPLLNDSNAARASNPLAIASLNIFERPENRQLYCSGAMLKKLADLALVKQEIAMLEDKILLGLATAADKDLLQSRRKKRAGLIKQLTLKQAAVFGSQGSVANWTGTTAAPDFETKWFAETQPDPAAVQFAFAGVEGRSGYSITINPTDANLARVSSLNANALSNDPQPLLVYRRPISAKVVVRDRACDFQEKCLETLELDAPLLIGQWGAIRSLPLSGGGLFGSREAAAKFDAFGTPQEMSYGTQSGAAGIASTVDAAGAAATSIADAEATRLEREIKREELRQKLKDLQETE
jgi:hypothetical protein